MSEKKPVLAVEDRFEFIDDNALQSKIDSLKNKNTMKADAKAEKKFVTYLKRKGLNKEFWLYGEQDLDKILCKFWFEVRTKHGEHYMIGSLENLRYSLNRVLHNKGHEYNIIIIIIVYSVYTLTLS